MHKEANKTMNTESLIYVTRRNIRDLTCENKI